MTSRRCCCDSGGCPCGSFSFDFEVARVGGFGGTERAIQKLSNVCSMLNEVDLEGTSVMRIVGTATFVCTQFGWAFDSGTAEYDPNLDLGDGNTGYFYSRPPVYSLGRCTDEGCVVCDATIVRSWTVTNDNTFVQLGAVSTVSSMPSWLAPCFPSETSTPANGVYRIVWLGLQADADRASREVWTNSPYPSGECPPDTDTTGSATAITPTNIYVGFLWDCLGICDEGTFVGAFSWNGTDLLSCTGSYPYDSSASFPTTQDYFCTPGPSAICCGGEEGVPINHFSMNAEGVLFDYGDATAANWTTT